MSDRLFYVYEHWRPDRGECFYVGKGRGGRANHMKPRNAHHMAIQAKLARLGTCVEVRIVADGLSEDDAFALERERIAFWRADGADLANMTDGGEGFTGGRHGCDTRKKMSSSRTGHSTSAGMRKKISDKLKGRKFSKETLAKMAESQRKRFQNPEQAEKILSSLRMASKTNQTPESRRKRAGKLRGVPRSEECRAKISASNKGRTISVEARAKMAIAKLGKKQSKETVEKRIATIKRKRELSK